MVETQVEELLPELAKYLELPQKNGWQFLRHPLVYAVPYTPMCNEILKT